MRWLSMRIRLMYTTNTNKTKKTINTDIINMDTNNSNMNLFYSYD